MLYRGRKGSRWPGADGLDEDDEDEDPSLKGPFGLQGGEGDHHFLSELNEKLETAARSRAVSPAPVFSPFGGFRTTGLDGVEEKGVDDGVVGEEGKKKEGNGEVGEGFVDQPEQEPKLRIKRSMNFGSQLCGKVE